MTIFLGKDWLFSPAIWPSHLKNMVNMNQYWMECDVRHQNVLIVLVFYFLEGFYNLLWFECKLLIFWNVTETRLYFLRSDNTCVECVDWCVVRGAASGHLCQEMSLVLILCVLFLIWLLNLKHIRNSLCNSTARYL